MSKITPENEAFGLTELAIEKLKELDLYSCVRCCKAHGWFGEVFEVVVKLLHDRLYDPPATLSVIALTCKHCGMVSMHNLKVLGLVE